MSCDDLNQALRDAGCDDEAAEELIRLCSEGETVKAQRLLSRHRKVLLDGIHAEERKISCLDYLEYILRKDKVS